MAANRTSCIAELELGAWVSTSKITLPVQDLMMKKYKTIKWDAYLSTPLAPHKKVSDETRKRIVDTISEIGQVGLLVLVV